MKNNSRKVSICDKNRNCVHAYGKNADLLTYAIVGVLALVGLSYAANKLSK